MTQKTTHHRPASPTPAEPVATRCIAGPQQGRLAALSTALNAAAPVPLASNGVIQRGASSSKPATASTSRPKAASTARRTASPSAATTTTTTTAAAAAASSSHVDPASLPAVPTVAPPPQLTLLEPSGSPGHAHALRQLLDAGVAAGGPTDPALSRPNEALAIAKAEAELKKYPINDYSRAIKSEIPAVVQRAIAAGYNLQDAAAVARMAPLLYAVAQEGLSHRRDTQLAVHTGNTGGGYLDSSHSSMAPILKGHP